MALVHQIYAQACNAGNLIHLRQPIFQEFKDIKKIKCGQERMIVITNDDRIYICNSRDLLELNIYPVELFS